MADTKTSALSSAAALTGAEQIPGVQSAASVKITGTQLADFAASRAQPAYQAATWYGPPITQVPTNAGVAADTLYCHPLLIRQACTITDLGVIVGSGVAATNCKLALYSDSGGKPGTLLSATAALSTATSSTDAKGALGANQTVSAGVIWAAALFSGTPGILKIVNADTAMADLVGATAAQGLSNLFGGAPMNIGYTGTGATYSGGFNGTFGVATLTASGLPCIGFKVQ